MDKRELEQLGKKIEQASGGSLCVHFQMYPLDKPTSAPLFYQYIGLILPPDAPLFLPIERNRSNALFWVEDEEREKVYIRLAAEVGVEMVVP